MKKHSLIISFVAAIAFLISCSGDTDVVESGTYKGEIQKVKPDETEIYVSTDKDKTLELYFTDETELTQDGKMVDFSELEKGQKVEVKVEKVGKRLDPLTVKILE